MLNMLIAIMSDTFERTIENRDLNAVKTKLEIMGEQASIIDKLDWNKLFSKKEDDSDALKSFLFIVTPDEVD